MTTSDHREGYKNAQGIGLSFEGLASIDNAKFIPVSIDSASRDWGNPDGSTHLRPYLALGYDSSSGRYKPFDGNLSNQTTVVVLAEEVRDMDQVTSFANSVAFFEAIFKNGVVIEISPVTWTNVQRIRIRDNI